MLFFCKHNYNVNLDVNYLNFCSADIFLSRIKTTVLACLLKSYTFWRHPLAVNFITSPLSCISISPLILILPAQPSSPISCFMWEKGLVVGFVGFKIGFSNSLIDSWETVVLRCWSKLVFRQYIILYEMLIYYGFVVIFRGECPRICCKLFVIFVFYTNPYRFSLHFSQHSPTFSPPYKTWLQ